VVRQLTICLLATYFSLGAGKSVAQDSSSNGSNAITIEYIAHACFRITSPSGKQLLIDPFASRVWIGYDYPDGIESDAVLITHPHYDHDGGVSPDHTPPWPDTRMLMVLTTLAASMAGWHPGIMCDDCPHTRRKFRRMNYGDIK